MNEEASMHWDIPNFPRIDGDPFEVVRRTCRHAVHAAKNVSIDEERLHAFARLLDCDAVGSVTKGHMGENCDIGASDFSHVEAAANAAVLFSLLQTGHGFRYELHRLCGRGASKTITLGLTKLKDRKLSAACLMEYGPEEVAETFELPNDASLAPLTLQLSSLMRQSGKILNNMGMADFHSFCGHVLKSEKAKTRPAAELVRALANTFPGFNDQGVLHDGSRVVLLKKASLAAGELRRVAAIHEPMYCLAGDAQDVLAPIDNVIPAVLVYHGVVRLSEWLESTIHHERKTLPRGPVEAELRAVSLTACEMIVETAGKRFSPLDLGYYLWLSGKEPTLRAFARHHTKDTVFY